MIDLHSAIRKLPAYPLSEIYQMFVDCLAQSVILLEAEPGAGKSTLAPLWVLGQVASGKQVILVQPRILAAQSVAQRLADLIQEPLGQTIGYQVAYDSCFNSSTQLLVVTPGILIQKLLNDSALDNVGAVILDEIHERSLQQDLLWAFLGELKVLRDDLQLVLMSATPDAQLKTRTHTVFKAKELFVAGRCFPVHTHYLPAVVENKNTFKSIESLDRHLLRALNGLNGWQEKTILVFLPSWYEIESCANRLAELFPQHPVYRLHSRVPNSEQKKALDARIGPRIILSTNIAETSLTIEDVTCVIDSGLANKVDFEQRSGLSRLKKARISQASAEQRRGRAGRMQAGDCIRLWSADLQLAPADLPEIRNADLLALALNLKLWGTDCEALEWIESPNRLAVQSANRQLKSMGLLSESQQITPLAKQVGLLGTHPRVATFLVMHSKMRVLTELDWLIALALYFETTIDIKAKDIESIVREFSTVFLRHPQWQKQFNRWRKQLEPGYKTEMNFAFRESWFEQIAESANLSVSLAIAYPERIGYLQSSGRYKLNSGMSLIGNLFELKKTDKKNSEWAVFPWIRSSGGDYKSIEHHGIGFELLLSDEQKRAFSEIAETLIYKSGAWQLQTEWYMGGCVIDQRMRPLQIDEQKSRLIPHLHAVVSDKGLTHFMPLSAQQFLNRVRIAFVLGLIDLSTLGVQFEKSATELNHCITEKFLLEHLELWLLPFLRLEMRVEELPWLSALEYYLGFENCDKIKHHLPSAVKLPSDRLATIDYSLGGGEECSAQISGKLQEFFGSNGISIAQGKIPLRIQLLSPNASPLAITQDLASFWLNAYPEVRKEMRGKYPRHPWPENPADHLPTALTKRALERKAASGKDNLGKDNFKS